VTITHYIPLFSEHHSGSTSFIHILSKPIAPIRDTATHQDDKDKLKQAIAKSKRKISTKLFFYGSHNADKAIQLNNLGYHTKQSVCFIDCIRLVNKYIGETEKNLSILIAQAESENWILFFDEADALFSRRSKVKDAHDQYSNQEISYLFKRLSRHPGLSILSLADKSNMDSVQYTVESVISFR
jgi:hypothetical protein